MIVFVLRAATKEVEIHVPSMGPKSRVKKAITAVAKLQLSQIRTTVVDLDILLLDFLRAEQFICKAIRFVNKTLLILVAISIRHAETYAKVMEIVIEQ